MNIFRSIGDKFKGLFKRRRIIKYEYIIVPVKEPEHANFRFKRPSTPKGTRKEELLQQLDKIYDERRK